MIKNKIDKIININENIEKKNIIICEKCRKFLGKYLDGNIITWNKINIDNCYCK